MEGFLSSLQEQRRQKAGEFRSLGIDPYPTRAHRTHTTAAAIARFDRIETEGGAEAVDDEQVTVAGRVVSFRHMGKSAFAHVRDGHGELQLYVRKDEVGEVTFERFLRLVDLGDWIEATGRLFRTKTGEVSLRVVEYAMLSKALNAPPEKWHGLQDQEMRFRQRYADLIANAEVREIFLIRSKVVSALR